MTLKKTAAWDWFSKFVRLRDKGRCYTCSKVADYREMDAGHYFHNCSIMFFEEKFVRCQCTGCNRFKHGNLGVYARRLIEEIGLEAFKEAERKSIKFKRWKPREIKEISKIYREKYNLIK